MVFPNVLTNGVPKVPKGCQIGSGTFGTLSLSAFGESHDALSTSRVCKPLFLVTTYVALLPESLGYFHFMVQPTGVVSAVEGSFPASTASRASLR